MLFGFVRKIAILMSLFLFVGNSFDVSGLVSAQSILSDRLWLEQKINLLIENDLVKQDNQTSFSGMSPPPLILNQSFTKPVLPENPELSHKIELTPKTYLSEIKRDDFSDNSSISLSSKTFKFALGKQ